MVLFCEFSSNFKLNFTFGWCYSLSLCYTLAPQLAPRETGVGEEEREKTGRKRCVCVGGMKAVYNFGSRDICEHAQTE